MNLFKLNSLLERQTKPVRYEWLHIIFSVVKISLTILLAGWVFLRYYQETSYVSEIVYEDDLSCYPVNNFRQPYNYKIDDNHIIQLYDFPQQTLSYLFQPNITFLSYIQSKITCAPTDEMIMYGSLADGSQIRYIATDFPKGCIKLQDYATQISKFIRGINSPYLCSRQIKKGTTETVVLACSIFTSLNAFFILVFRKLHVYTQDAYKYAKEQIEGENEEPIDVVVQNENENENESNKPNAPRLVNDSMANAPPLYRVSYPLRDKIIVYKDDSDEEKDTNSTLKHTSSTIPTIAQLYNTTDDDTI